MTYVEVVHPGERIVKDVVIITRQTTAPAPAPPVNVGLVEISQSMPTELIPGPPGPQGEQGEPGADSTVPGPQGPEGPEGPQGIQGIQGIQGNTGSQGPQGNIGATGPQGPQGDPGATGSQGPQGNPGPTGSTGPTGPGVAAGGTTGQVLTKIDATDYNTNWQTPATGGGGSGDVVGPASSVDNVVPRFDLTTGKLIQESTFTLQDDGKFTLKSGANTVLEYGTTGTSTSGGLIIKPMPPHAQTLAIIPRSDSTGGTIIAGSVTFDNTISIGAASHSNAVALSNSTSGTTRGLKIGSGLLNLTPAAGAPSSPTNGDIWTTATSAYARINGVTVDLAAAAGGTATSIADTFPGSPVSGQLHWESDTGILWIYYTDANSSQWVQATGSGGDNVSAAADMSIGFRTGGNRFVVNDKADLTGTDVMTVNEAGQLVTTGNLNVNGGTINCTTYQGWGTSFIAGTASAGTVYLRPNGTGSTTGQTTIDSAGSMIVATNFSTATGRVTAGNDIFAGAGTNIILAPTTAGTVYLRPGTAGVTTGQTTIDSAGTMTVVAPYSATGAAAGLTITAGRISQSTTATTTSTHHAFYSPNGNVGNIQTNASATAYVTSSDARLKEFKANYDPAEAIAIIRADPVKSFTWKATGEDAVGWFAQSSYAVDKNLALPPPEEAKDDDDRWGIDYGRRTPYLWAALTHALDKIEALEARIAALEGSNGV